MKKKLFLATLVAIFAVTAACESRISVRPSKNYVVHQVEGITDFNAIEVSGTFDVKYTVKPGEPTVNVHYPDNMAEYLDISVKNKTLVIKLKRDVVITGNHELKVTASSAGLRSVKGSGVSDVELKGEIKSDDFKITLSGTRELEADAIICKTFESQTSGTGGINIDRLDCEKATVQASGTSGAEISHLSCTDVKASVSGTGEIELKGNAVNAVFTTTGTSEIEAGKLVASNVKASATGTSHIQCHASESISAESSGLGSITYFGMPATTDLKGKTGNIKSR